MASNPPLNGLKLPKSFTDMLDGLKPVLSVDGGVSDNRFRSYLIAALNPVTLEKNDSPQVKAFLTLADAHLKLWLQDVHTIMSVDRSTNGITYKHPDGYSPNISYNNNIPTLPTDNAFIDKYKDFAAIANIFGLTSSEASIQTHDKTKAVDLTGAGEADRLKSFWQIDKNLAAWVRAVLELESKGQPSSQITGKLSDHLSGYDVASKSRVQDFATDKGDRAGLCTSLDAAQCKNVFDCLLSNDPFQSKDCDALFDSSNDLSNKIYTAVSTKQVDLPTLKKVLVNFGFMASSGSKVVLTLDQWAKSKIPTSATGDATAAAEFKTRIENLKNNTILLNFFSYVSDVVRNEVNKVNQSAAPTQAAQSIVKQFVVPPMNTILSLPQPSQGLYPNVQVQNTGSRLGLFGGNFKYATASQMGGVGAMDQLERAFNQALNALKQVNKQLDDGDIQKIRQTIADMKVSEEKLVEILNGINVYVNTNNFLELQKQGNPENITLKNIIDSEQSVLENAKSRLIDIAEGKATKIEQVNDNLNKVVSALLGLLSGSGLNNGILVRTGF